MKQLRTLSLSALTLAVLAACSSVPAHNARLDEASNDYRVAQGDPQTSTLAPLELKQAGEAIEEANEAWARNSDPARVDHLAYLAKQRVALANEAGRRKAAETAVARASADRDQLLLAARTREADSAQSSARAAQRDARDSQRESDAARRDAEIAQRQSAASQLQASDADQRSRGLEVQLAALNAKKTERGLVVTISEVLFDTDRAQIKPGARRSIDKLGAFLKEHPQRTALVEGYTDSTGSDSHNQELSSRRADAVRAALVELGVQSDRVSSHGYGEAFPVAGNDDAGGRQLNRRVEIIVSEDGGTVAPR
jgi:outer membrane protein OmpA-like peptidoglycan-associated protein